MNRNRSQIYASAGAYCIKLLLETNSGYGKVNGKFMLTGVFRFDLINPTIYRKLNVFVYKDVC